MNVCVIRDVVSVVTERRGIKWQKPDGRDAQVLQVFQLLRESAEVAVAVSDRVAKSPNVDLVNDGVLVPQGIAGAGVRVAFPGRANFRVPGSVNCRIAAVADCGHRFPSNGRVVRSSPG